MHYADTGLAACLSEWSSARSFEHVTEVQILCSCLEHLYEPMVVAVRAVRAFLGMG